MPDRPSPARTDLGQEADVEVLVRRFYEAARVDAVLGPVFAAADLDWDAHIERVVAFWNWQLLGGRRYDGRPLQSHRRVAGLVPFTEAHYERWLELFTDTVEQRWTGPVADLAVARAHRMARSMRRVLADRDDPEPSWPEEGVEPGPPPSGRGVVMRVALGPAAGRRPPAPPDEDGASTGDR